MDYKQTAMWSLVLLLGLELLYALACFINEFYIDMVDSLITSFILGTVLYCVNKLNGKTTNSS